MSPQPNRKKPPELPYGTLVRTIWKDEYLDQYSFDDNIGRQYWDPDGLEGFPDFQKLHRFMKGGIGADQQMSKVPFGTKGFMIVDHHWINKDRRNGGPLWYKLLLQEKFYWLAASSVVLEKKSTQ